MRLSAVVFLLTAAVYGQAPPDGVFQPEKLKKYKLVDAIAFRPMGGLPSPVM